MDENTRQSKGRKPQTRSEAGEFSRRQAASGPLRRRYTRRQDEVDTFASRPARPVAVIDLEAGADEPRPRRVRRIIRKRGEAKRPAAPRPTIRFASTGRTSSRVIRSVGYNVWTGLNLTRIVCGLALVGLLVLGYWLLTAPNFLISQVKLNGSHFLDVPGVIAQTGVDKTNVFLLDEKAVADKLKQLPYVLDAKVEKALPNQLNVQVVERQEAVNWKIGSTNYLVDKEGMVLEAVPTLPDEAAKFPVINSLDNRELKVGDKVDAVAVQSVQLLLPGLTQNGFELASLDYSPVNGLTAVSKDGKWQALFGTSDELDKKISILKGLLADSSVKWKFADLRWTSRPAVQ